MTRYKRPLNPIATTLKPLFAIPGNLASTVGQWLWDGMVWMEQHGRGNLTEMIDLYDGRLSFDDLIAKAYRRQNPPVADLAPVRQLPYYPQKSPETHSNGVCCKNGATPVVTPDRLSNSRVAKNSGGNGKATRQRKQSAKMADETLYAKQGKKYVAAEPGQDGELYRRVKRGSGFRYVPA